MRTVLFFIFLSVILLPASAQRFYGGLLGGFTASQLEGDYYRGYNKLGGIAGTWVQIDLGNNLFAGMELKFVQKGSYKRPSKLDPYRLSYQLNYIDLPVLIGYQYASTVSAFAGLSFNYLLGRYAYDNYGKVDLVAYPVVEPWEIGTILGIRTDFEQLVRKPWAQRLSLDVRFQYSMFSISKPHRFFIGNRYFGQYNNLISTTIYYRMDWGANQSNY